MNFFTKLKGLYCGHLRYYMHPYVYRALQNNKVYRIFGQKWPKIEAFRKFWVEKLFSKKNLYPLLERFIVVLLSHHTYMYL